jgi:hypothetical protein
MHQQGVLGMSPNESRKGVAQHRRIAAAGSIVSPKSRIGQVNSLTPIIAVCCRAIWP